MIWRFPFICMLPCFECDIGMKSHQKKDRKRLPGKPLPEKVVSGKSEVTFQNPQFHKEIF